MLLALDIVVNHTDEMAETIETDIKIADINRKNKLVEKKKKDREKRKKDRKEKKQKKPKKEKNRESETPASVKLRIERKTTMNGFERERLLRESTRQETFARNNENVGGEFETKDEEKEEENEEDEGEEEEEIKIQTRQKELHCGSYSHHKGRRCTVTATSAVRDKLHVVTFGQPELADSLFFNSIKDSSFAAEKFLNDR